MTNRSNDLHNNTNIDFQIGNAETRIYTDAKVDVLTSVDNSVITVLSDTVNRAQFTLIYGANQLDLREVR